MLLPSFWYNLGNSFSSIHLTLTVFQFTEDVLAYLGPFAPVMKNIRDELYRSVYSKDVTSAQSEPFVKRIPYFQIAGRIEEEKYAFRSSCATKKGYLLPSRILGVL